jgi:hypothetical protein
VAGAWAETDCGVSADRKSEAPGGVSKAPGWDGRRCSMGPSMSNKILNAVFEHSKTRHSTRLLLLALADRADDSGRAWPSIADIMHRTGLSRGAIHGAMREAGEIGELSIKHFAGPRLCNVYLLHVPTRSNSEPVQTLNPVQNLSRPVQTLNTTRSDSEPKPHITHKNPKSTSKRNFDGFDDFWNLYPRKVGKADARKAWSTAKHLPDLATLRTAIEKQTASEQWRNPKYIPHPSTWIRGERWNDEVTTTTTHRPTKAIL